MTGPWGQSRAPRARWQLLMTPLSVLLLAVGVLYVVAARTGATTPSVSAAAPGAPAEGGHDHALAMVTASGGAYVARAAVLPTRGWSARADAAAKGHRASFVLDGRRGTTWQTPKRAKAPHVITLDTKAVRTLTGLRYTPEAGASARRLGRYTVAISRDGRRWTVVNRGRFDRSAAVKTASFRAVDARYVRLSATNAVGAKRAVAVAELAVLGGPIADVVLDRTGWSAAADSQDPGDFPALAIDGNQATFWQSVVTDVPAPKLPHSLVIDTGAAQRMAALSYTPRQDEVAGRIGGFVVEVSGDGVAYRRVAGGTWADDATTKTIQFATTTARWVRLRATTEAGGRGPVVSAAELNLYGPPGGAAPVTDPGTSGAWGPVIGLPIVPTTAILLPGDKVLTMSAAYNTTFTIDDPPNDRTQISIIDVSQGDGGRPGQREVRNTQHQMFCTGLSILADGRVLITGGSSSKTTTIYDPVTDTFTRAPDMVVPRGYQTSVTLSDGEVFAIGGSWSGGEHDKGVLKDGELMAADASSWRPLPGTKADNILTDDGEGAYRADNHAWLFADTGGRAFHAGPSDQINWFDTAGDGLTTPVGRRGTPDAMNGNAVMYAEDKILTLGGSPAYGFSDATNLARTIDISAGYPVRPEIAATDAMAESRAFVNSVVLADGSVVVTGGQSYAVPFTDSTAHLSAELWEPTVGPNGQFRTLASEAVPRTYHSFSLLLQDGRVLSGGGGLQPNSEVNHPDVQILTPPNLLKADGSPRVRPRMTSLVPTTMAAGSSVRITTDRPIASWAMTRVGTSTHSINSDQRRFELEATRVGTTGNTYEITVPADRGTSVPGPYLLWAVDQSGTPSRGAWVRVPL